MSLLLLFQSGEGGTPPVVVPPPIISGGYGFGAYDRKRRRRDELEEEEREELADRLEAVMVAEGSITQEKADLIRLRGMVDDYEAELPNRIARAIAYAERVRTQQALDIAIRELRKMQEDEAFAILLTLSLD